MRVALSPQLPEITSEIFTSASAVVGIRGSGKTNDGVVLAEQAIGIGVPVVVIDPTGVWYGLKSSRDGKRAGLPVYVFGGEHGDVPLDADAGLVIARFVVDERVPIVLDVSDLTKTKQRRFVGQFCEALYDLKARNREVVLLIIDEAPRFCPQQLQRGDVELARCVGAVEDIVALGRSRGLGCAIIGQRPAAINKNILTQADNLFAMRTVGAQDRKAIDEWVVEAQGDQQQRDELVRNLAALPQGEGYFWSPAIFGVFRRVKFAERSTFDSSRTPKAGEKRIEPKAFAQVDLEALRGEIAAAVEKAKADDPKALRAQLAERDRRIRELEARPAVAAEPERVEVPVLGGDQLAALRGAVGRVDDAIATAKGEILEAVGRAGRTLEEAAAAFGTALGPIAEALRAASPSPPAVAPARMGGEIGKRIEQERSDRRRPGHPAAPHVALALDRDRRGDERRGSARDAGDLGGGPMKTLRALAGAPQQRATRTQLGFLAGYSAGGGTFAKYMSELRGRDLVAGDGSAIVLTDAGRALVGDSAAPVTTEGVLAMWLAKLGGGPRKMLIALIQVWPQGLTRDELGAQTGFEPSGGTYAKYLSTLSGLDIIERRGSTIVASEALFPTGRPR